MSEAWPCCVCVFVCVALNPFFDGKAALSAKAAESARVSQEVVEELLERTRKVRVRQCESRVRH